MHKIFALIILACVSTDHSDVGQILNSRLAVVKIAREAWSSSDPKVHLCVYYFTHTLVPTSTVEVASASLWCGMYIVHVYVSTN